MKPEYRELRLLQLGHTLAAFKTAKSEVRPQRGWLRAIRQALGLSLERVARTMNVSRSQVLLFEKSEAQDRISLHSLRRVAEAMGCELVYAIVPKFGTIQELAEQRARADATQRVLSVEHSMALEGQSADGVKQNIEDETKRILKRS
jgi:predicted DNA-binding mobile mystery protein A